MKSNRQLTQNDAEMIDELLAGNYQPYQQNILTPTQYISHSCYGYNLRQCDILLPRIPSCYVNQGQQDAVAPEKDSQNQATCSFLKWSVLPPNVVQLGNLPIDCDTEVWRDVVASHGTILNSEVQKTNRETFLRYKLNDPGSCDWLVSNIDNVDVLGTGHKIKCRHLKS
ncbi:methyltransferase-like protein 12, mitochondrial [Elysia marginata]|uniref:Methyltransferase-like protein 12, mitochondrial n=1 Tax=Elysia marginata TaxID=1093978 RepID=A0AAV4G1B9_9GAST|nr:methyltransferase-like protein 12, mitochondrial [Elysia marginata]